PAPGPPALTEIPRDLNVVMISIDSLRADMPWAGYPRPIAPFLTRLEAESVSYTRAYAASSYTSQSVGGFLGGRLPSELRRDGYFFGTYPSRVVFFPERLQAAGIRTIAAQSHGYFRAGHAGFEQGFDAWRMVPNTHWNATTDVDITGVAHADLAIRLLTDPANTSRRFFAWFHFMDPHDQYQAHPGINYGRRVRDRYDGEVTFTDRQVERLVTFIRAQPWGARTAIVVTADHGEAFGEHGFYRHAFQLWQPLVRVPWFFSIPGAAPRRIAANRSHVDLAPTILELFGLPPEPEFTGRSLVGEFRGAAPEERDVWVDLARTGNNDRRRGLIHGQYKLTAYGDDSRFELYDVEADPGELTNLARSRPEVYADMVRRYRGAQSGIRNEHVYGCHTLTGAPPGRGW
ncbi:MAG: Choline-sulfatase, partial [Myxococcaceae bacterium]|nr:Choline-sulfatase [Myxococcaceae bacterium]